jgi:hypothetical protein
MVQDRSQSQGPCEHGNGRSGSAKGGEFLDHPSGSQLPNKDPAP